MAEKESMYSRKVGIQVDSVRSERGLQEPIENRVRKNNRQKCFKKRICMCFEIHVKVDFCTYIDFCTSNFASVASFLSVLFHLLPVHFYLKSVETTLRHYRENILNNFVTGNNLTQNQTDVQCTKQEDFP